jgi:hypothetical protein
MVRSCSAVCFAADPPPSARTLWDAADFCCVIGKIGRNVSISAAQNSGRWRQRDTPWSTLIEIEGRSMSTAVELHADAQRISTFALGVTSSEVAELHAMIQELEHPAAYLGCVIPQPARYPPQIAHGPSLRAAPISSSAAGVFRGVRRGRRSAAPPLGSTGSARTSAQNCTCSARTTRDNRGRGWRRRTRQPRRR